MLMLVLRMRLLLLLLWLIVGAASVSPLCDYFVRMQRDGPSRVSRGMRLQYEPPRRASI
jgi:hypothetical protein